MKISSINNFETLQVNIPQQKSVSTSEKIKENVLENTQHTEVEQSEHDVIQAIEKANKHIKVYDRRLEFSIHEATKQIMVKVINTEDDTVIREIPSEKILDLVAHLWELAGILVDEKR